MDVDNSQKKFCYVCNAKFDEDYEMPTCPHCDTGIILHEYDRHLVPELLGTPDDNVAAMVRPDEAVGPVNNAQNQAASQMPRPMTDIQYLNRMQVWPRRMRGIPAYDNGMDELTEVLRTVEDTPTLVTARSATGTPGYRLVDSSGEHIHGGEGFDTVVTHILGQIESQHTNQDIPPMSKEQISDIPKEKISAEKVKAHAACSICWSEFKLDELVSKLKCDHLYHEVCIVSWLQQHATCPTCRLTLIDYVEPPRAAAPQVVALPPQILRMPARFLPTLLEFLSRPPENQQFPPVEIPLDIDMPAASQPPIVLPPEQDITQPAAPLTLANPEPEPDSDDNAASSSPLMSPAPIDSSNFALLSDSHSGDHASVAPVANSNQGPGLRSLWTEINSTIMSLSNFNDSSESTSGDRASVAPVANSNQEPGMRNLWAGISSSIMSPSNFDDTTVSTSGDRASVAATDLASVAATDLASVATTDRASVEATELAGVASVATSSVTPSGDTSGFMDVD